MENNFTNGVVISYPWPAGLSKYAGISMKAGGKNIDLYSVRANNTYCFRTDAQDICDQVPVGMFDMSGTVQIEIILPDVPSNVIVRPLSSGINPEVNENIITFSIDKPGQYSVEYDNNIKNTILVFANPVETFTGTTVLEAGVYNQNFTVDDGQTLYLKPGAVIRGNVFMNSNSKITGRGIIDGSVFENWNRVQYRVIIPIETNGGNNIEINGITIFDSNGWSVQLLNSCNVTISNLKIASSRCNSDGISIQSSNNITIRDCFIRAWDDGIVIKNYRQTDSYKITVKNCRLWIDLAQCLEIGFETNKGKKPDPKIYDVVFENIEILHAFHKAPVSIHNGDNAEIFNIIYKNILIEDYHAGESEDGWNYLIDITNMTGDAVGGRARWTTITERGSIHDVLIDNVKILSGKVPNARFDSSQGGSIYNVVIKDIYHGSDKLDFSCFMGGNTAIDFM